VIDLARISTLVGIEASADAVTIKAATTHYDVATSDAVKKALPALAALAGGIGDPQVRHRGTIGGSVANNDPSADYPAAVLALGATVKTNKRAIAADDFFKGLFTTALEEGEVITAISFPIPVKAGYAKLPNPASRYALTGVFAVKTKSGAVRAAATGASQSGVMRLADVEKALSANWSEQALDSVTISPNGLIADVHGTAAYRANLIVAMAKRAVAAAG
jgi:carbon-monoxide dehydrogenase medium subunit